jgi:formylglycine-generating enzyme required for sulfatase activity
VREKILVEEFTMIRVLAVAAMLFALPAQAVVTIDWVTVGDPGNAADTTGYGAVSDEYRIGKYEVTNAQYAEFLNAVAATDTNALYSTCMGNSNPDNPCGYGGITRSGSSGSYTYSTIASREDMPVNHVSFYDALRFANWLHNGQPTGAQDSTTTEDGAYTMITESYPSTVITRKAGAKVVLTSEDEWYKAAYYKGGGTSAGYWDYPAGSDTETTCATPGATANTANCNLVVFDVTDGGSYTGSASPRGTFDQGGNVHEWNEAIIGGIYGIFRSVRGGDFIGYPWSLVASSRGVDHPSYEGSWVGFRVASLAPEPPVPSLSPVGFLILVAGLLGFGVYRRGSTTRG